MATVIIKKGDKYYFTSEDQVYELNESTIGRLKISIVLPAKVYFRDCPFTFIGEIIEALFDKQINVEVNRVKGTQEYIASFTEVPEKTMK